MNKNINYKKEKYLKTNKYLIARLDKIATKLKKQLLTEGEYYKVDDYINDVKKFNDLWKVKPNNLDNDHSKNEFKGI